MIGHAAIPPYFPMIHGTDFNQRDHPLPIRLRSSHYPHQLIIDDLCERPPSRPWRGGIKGSLACIFGLNDDPVGQFPFL